MSDMDDGTTQYGSRDDVERFMAHYGLSTELMRSFLDRIDPPKPGRRVGYVDGQRYDVPAGYECVRAEHVAKLRAFANLISDLDRSSAGRHQGDAESQDPSGISQGNPILPEGKHIGYTIGGRHIVVPARADRHDPACWIIRAHD